MIGGCILGRHGQNGDAIPSKWDCVGWWEDNSCLLSGFEGESDPEEQGGRGEKMQS